MKFGRSLVLLGLGVVLLWVLLRPPLRDVAAEPHPPVPAPVPEPAQVDAGAEPQRSDLLEVVLVGQLTAERIVLSPERFALEVHSGETYPLADKVRLKQEIFGGGEVMIHYSLPSAHGAVPFECESRGRLEILDDSAIITIPFTAEIVAEIQETSRHNAPVDFTTPVFHPLDREALDELREAHGWPLFSESSLRGLVHKGISEVQGQPFTTDPAGYTWRGAYLGTGLISTWSESTGVAFEFVEALPGQRVRARIAPVGRPIIRGRILDWRQNPVPGAKVSVSTVLDNDNFDFTSHDNGAGMGILVGGPKDNYTRTTKSRVFTDDGGCFLTTVPRGGAFSVEVNHHGAYAFTTKNAPMLSNADEWEVTLVLSEPIPENGITIEVRNWLGQPLAHALVGLDIVDDFPYFRQFPQKEPVDATGSVVFYGIPIGSRVGLRIRHPEIRSMYVPPFAYVTEKRLTVTVPKEAFTVHPEATDDGVKSGANDDD